MRIEGAGLCTLYKRARGLCKCALLFRVGQATMALEMGRGGSLAAKRLRSRANASLTAPVPNPNAKRQSWTHEPVAVCACNIWLAHMLYASSFRARGTAKKC